MDKKYGKISNIVVDDLGSWQNKIFLTFDIDWAHDEIINDCYELISQYNIFSTWFVTHDCDFIKMADKRIEFGIHPNLNPLLNGEKGFGAREVVESYASLVPGAKAIRSHSLVHSERLIDVFYDLDFTHISNSYIPYSSNIEIKPFCLWNGMITVPHSFQDNAAIKMLDKLPSKRVLSSGFHVFDFHPIHVFLNTECLARYEKTRNIHSNPTELRKFQNNGYGVRNWLIDVLETGML